MDNAAQRLESRITAVYHSVRRPDAQGLIPAPFTQNSVHPPEIRKVTYTTNAIESVNMSLRKLTKNRGSYPSDEALTKLFYLALRNISRKCTLPIRDWKAALTRFTIQFGDRVSVSCSPNRLHKNSNTPLTWTLEVRLRGRRRFICAVPASYASQDVESIAPFELTVGRDFLVAIRTFWFELTGLPVTEADLRTWVARLCTVDPSYGKNAKAALASEAMYSIEELPDAALPILYRNSRLLVVDARTAQEFS